MLARLATRLTTLSPTGVRARRRCDGDRSRLALGDGVRVGGGARHGHVPGDVCADAAGSTTIRDSSIGCATVAMAALGFTGHGRLLPLVPVVLALLLLRCVMAPGMGVWCGDRRRVAVVTTLLSYLLRDAVFDAAWDDPASSNTVGTVIKRLPQVLDNLRSALGQTWYQLVATAGLTAIGTGVLLVRAVRRRRRVVPDVVIRDARLVLARHRSADPRVDRVHVGPHPHRPPDLRPLQRRRPVAGAGRRHRLAGAAAPHAPSASLRQRR